MAWAPGESGNLDGAKRSGKWREMLERAITQDDGKRLRAAAEALLDAAASGDLPAIKELADRLDGKPSQQIVATDDEGRSLAVALIQYSPQVVGSNKEGVLQSLPGAESTQGSSIPSGLAN